MNEQKTCRHNCAKYDVAEPKNCYKNLQCAKQDGCKIPTSKGIIYVKLKFYNGLIYMEYEHSADRSAYFLK